jgi:ring-1,2-phenylacetyl-CoA epoxidase subunit PaaE
MGSYTVEIDPERSRHYILIGAGSGIAPLMAIARSVLAGEPASKVTLWYGNRNEESIIFKEELLDMRHRYGERFFVYFTLSQPSLDWKGMKGRLDREHVYELISELFMTDEYRKAYYLCGPEAMMEEARSALEKHAINPFDIFQEHYHAPLAEPIAETTGNGSSDPVPASIGPAPVDHSTLHDREMKVVVEGERYALRVPAGATILDAAIAAGLEPPYSCQSGTCSSCRAKRLQGQVAMDRSLGLSEMEREADYVLTCQAYPLTDDVVVDYE